MDNQQQITFNPMTYRKLSVYEVDKRELSVGDFIRITRNDKDLDLANGDQFKVSSVTPDEVTLKNELREIKLNPKQALHLDYSYATTVDSSEGLTADRVLMSFSQIWCMKI